MFQVNEKDTRVTSSNKFWEVSKGLGSTLEKYMSKNLLILLKLRRLTWFRELNLSFQKSLKISFISIKFYFILNCNGYSYYLCKSNIETIVFRWEY